MDDEQILINGNPIFFRAPLSWGWYEDYRAPNPPMEVFRKELQRVRALGFNGMKLCLWIPPQSYFDLADEMGILLWVELPMWLPDGTKFCREQTPGEYRRIVQQIGDILLALNEKEKLTILLVEQKLPFARRVGRSFYVLDRGRNVASGSMDQLTDDIVQRYLVV